MVVERGSEFYGEQYFDPDPGEALTSNYRHDSNKDVFNLVVFPATTTLHIILETVGPRAFFREMDVIDLGGAKGNTAFGLQRFMPKSRVFNADWSEYATCNANPKVKARTLRCNIRELPVCDGRFDLVLCIDVLEHMAENTIPGALSEIHRIMKPGAKGILIPNIGEDAATSIDQSHVAIKPAWWWRDKILSCGFYISERPSIALTRILGRSPLFKRFPTIRPGLFIVGKN